MNETEADGVGDYKLKRRGEPTGFMKRFKETPLVIFGTDPNEFKRHKTAEVVNSFPSMGTPWKPVQPSFARRTCPSKPLLEAPDINLIS